MGLFGGGDEKRKKLEEAMRKAASERRKELEKIISRPVFDLPKGARATIYPSEYRLFLKEVKKKPAGFYERACGISEKILPITASKKDSEKMNDDIKASYLNVTPNGVFAFTLILLFLSFILTFVSLIFNLGIFTLFLFLLLMGATYFTYTYPGYKARQVTSQMSSDSILAILYIIIYMRATPNLEGAIRFAAENLSGPLSWDLKKLLWSIEVGTYRTADEALSAYIDRWKSRNEEFAEALNLLRGSAVEPARREKLFDETINLVLEGTLERTKKYVLGMRMPVMLIHAMGVLLPVMGLVLFPIVMIFMSDVVKPVFLFLGYDVVLPLFLWFFIDHMLKNKPPTFSQPDISLAKDVPPLGKYKLGDKLIPLLPISILIILIFGGASAYLFFEGGAPEGKCSDAIFKTNASLALVVSLAFGIIFYTFFDSLQKVKIRQDIEEIENEFSVALFQLGNQISSGSPVETAVDNVSEKLKGMKISNLFSLTSSNMRRFGYTFEQALFDKNVGAIWWYPSRLVRSIMGTIAESSKKGVVAASNAMVTISKYLKGMHDVKQSSEEILGETTTSMKFLSNLLTPLVAGVTVTMAVVMIQILGLIGSQLSTFASGQGPGESSFGTMNLLGVFKNGQFPIGPGEFQLIVGLYMLETIIILSIFVTRVEYGDDDIGIRKNIAMTLLIGVFVYALSWFITYAMFGDPLRTMITPQNFASAVSSTCL